MHGTTFGGGPLACRVALAVLMLIDELLPAVRENGVFLFECLRGLQDRHSIVNEVRGTGLMAGIDLSVPGERIVLACLDRGLAINCTHRTVLRLLPPYIVGRAEIEKAVSILGEVLSED
jgi:acetylornithine/succinyldiaminopimelate/putrescine aminotransferase